MPEPIDIPRPPAGDYAIVEILGHRTIVGRVAEVERFGTKLLQVEPIFQGALLDPVLIGGSSIYQFTPCPAEVAFRKGPSQVWELPASVSALLPPEALPAPTADWCDDGEEPEFVPAFLRDDDHG